MTIIDSQSTTMRLGLDSGLDEPDAHADMVPYDRVRPADIEDGDVVRITSRAGTEITFVVEGSEGSFRTGRVRVKKDPGHLAEGDSADLRPWIQMKVWDEAVIRRYRPLSITVCPPGDRPSVVSIGEVATVERSTSLSDSRG